MRRESQVGEHTVDERKDVEAEIDRQLPRVLQRERFLIAERVVADGEARDVAFVEGAHHLLVERGLSRQLRRVFGQDRVDDQRVVGGDQIAAGTVERVREAAGFTGHRPSLRADRLRAVEREVLVAAVMEDAAVRQVAREEREFRAHPFGQLALRPCVRDLFDQDHDVRHDSGSSSSERPGGRPALPR